MALGLSIAISGRGVYQDQGLLSWLFGVLAEDEYRVVSAEAKGV